MADRNRVTVTIFGEQYVMRTSKTAVYVNKLAEMVDQRMSDLADRHQQLGVSKLAVLCALALADELVQTAGDNQ